MLTGEDRELCILASEYRELSQKLAKLLRPIKPTETTSKMQSFWSALKHKVHEKEKEELEQQLNNCSNQINLQLTFLNRISLQALVDSASDNATKFERLRESIDALRQSVHTTIISGEIEEQIHRLIGHLGRRHHSYPASPPCEQFGI